MTSHIQIQRSPEPDLPPTQPSTPPDTTSTQPSALNGTPSTNNSRPAQRSPSGRHFEPERINNGTGPCQNRRRIRRQQRTRMRELYFPNSEQHPTQHGEPNGDSASARSLPRPHNLPPNLDPNSLIRFYTPRHMRRYLREQRTRQANSTTTGQHSQAPTPPQEHNGVSSMTQSQQNHESDAQAGSSPVTQRHATRQINSPVVGPSPVSNNRPRVPHFHRNHRIQTERLRRHQEMIARLINFPHAGPPYTSQLEVHNGLPISQSRHNSPYHNRSYNHTDALNTMDGIVRSTGESTETNITDQRNHASSEREVLEFQFEHEHQNSPTYGDPRTLGGFRPRHPLLMITGGINGFEIRTPESSQLEVHNGFPMAQSRPFQHSSLRHHGTYPAGYFGDPRHFITRRARRQGQNNQGHRLSQSSQTYEHVHPNSPRHAGTITQANSPIRHREMSVAHGQNPPHFNFSVLGQHPAQFNFPTVGGSPSRGHRPEESEEEGDEEEGYPGEHNSPHVHDISSNGLPHQAGYNTLPRPSSPIPPLLPIGYNSPHRSQGNEQVYEFRESHSPDGARFRERSPVVRPPLTYSEHDLPPHFGQLDLSDESSASEGEENVDVVSPAPTPRLDFHDGDNGAGRWEMEDGYQGAAQQLLQLIENPLDAAPISEDHRLARLTVRQMLNESTTQLRMYYDRLGLDPDYLFDLMEQIHITELDMFAIQEGLDRLRRGMVQSDIDERIPAQKCHRDTAHPEAETPSCCICLCEMEEGEEERLLPCGHHHLHKPCIDKWLQNDARCPVCRKDVRYPDN